MDDEVRNATIIADVIAAIKANRSPVVLTERRKHVEQLAEKLSPHILNVIVMKGAMGEKKRREWAGSFGCDST